MPTEETLQEGDVTPETLQEQSSDSATDMVETPEENNIGTSSDATTEEAQSNEPSGFTKRIHQKHHELMEEKRANLELQNKIEELQKQVPKDIRPDIPDVPDPYDDDYEAKIADRDRVLAEASAYDAKQEILRQQELKQQQYQAYEKQQQQIQKEQAFSTNAGKLGVSENELATSIQTIAAYGGLGNTVADYVLTDNDGPAITSFLAKNPEHVTAIQGMNPVQAGIYLETKVRPNVSKQTNTTPTPPDTLGGGGAPPVERGPKGATFE